MLGSAGLIDVWVFLASNPPRAGCVLCGEKRWDSLVEKSPTSAASGVRPIEKVTLVPVSHETAGRQPATEPARTGREEKAHDKEKESNANSSVTHMKVNRGHVGAKQVLD